MILIAGVSNAGPAEKAGIILLTGFEPFGENQVNPSQLIVEHFNGTQLAGRRIYSLVLPVVYFKAAATLKQAIDELSPDIVISLGLDNKSSCIQLEKIAWNIIASLQPDNEGTIILFRPVAPGPLFIPSDFPVAALTESLQEAYIPAAVSWYAGSFVCNNVFYETLLHTTSAIRGFIHVPHIPPFNPQGIPLETLIEAVQIVLVTVTTVH
jgi:pyroglutamyl-peptidase